MITCNNCGIEMEPGFDECPLCHHKTGEPVKPPEVRKGVYPNLDHPLTFKERAHLIWELSGILLFSSLLTVLIIDLMINKKPAWSLYAILGIISTFIYITLLVFLARKTFLFLAGLLVTTMLFLAGLDLLDPGADWFILPALPLVFFFIVLLALVMLFIRKTSHRGLNVIAMVSLAIGLYVMCVEFSIGWTLGDPWPLSWSVIVAASIVPFALFLFYFHYRLKRGTSLRKFFHL